MNLYAILADTILIIHTAFIGFVILGLLLTVIGLRLHWRWVRNFWFRLGHLLAIAIVVMQSWLGIVCPLTTLEYHFRIMGREATHSGDFIAYWLHKLIFFRADPWVFTLVYSIVGGLVLATWVFGCPQIKLSKPPPHSSLQKND